MAFNPQFKINQMAKDMGLKSKELTDLLADKGIGDVKSQKTLTEQEFNVLFQSLTEANQVDNIYDYMDGKTCIPSKIAAAKAAEKAAKAAEKKKKKKAEKEAKKAEKAAEEALEQNVRYLHDSLGRTDCKAGAIVAIDPRNGEVIGLRCVEMELGEPDASGRRRPIVKEGSEFVLDIPVEQYFGTDVAVYPLHFELVKLFLDTSTELLA